VRWRQLKPGELNHELLWLSVSLAAFVIGWVLIRSGIPLPKCVWHELTGLPCPGCGGTRCARAIVSGLLWTAFLMNPFVFTAFIAIAVYDVYAAIVLLFRLPRLRFDHIPQALGFWGRIGAAALFACNWAWLIVARR
jgi:hypothetical protein